MPADSNTSGDALQPQAGLEAKRTDTPATAASASPTAGPAQGQPVDYTGPTGTAMPSAAELAKVLRGVRIADSTPGSTHLFWDTQPVVKAAELKSLTAADEGPIDSTKTVDDVRKVM